MLTACISGPMPSCLFRYVMQDIFPPYRLIKKKKISLTILTFYIFREPFMYGLVCFQSLLIVTCNNVSSLV